MGREIERKFLFKGGFQYTGFPKKEIVQDYISFEPELRIRKEDGVCTFTMKGLGDMSRPEEEMNISSEMYEYLLTYRKKDLSICKDRYYIGLRSEYFESPIINATLDIYKGELSEFQVIEVEFDSEEKANDFVPPSWFGKEITGDKRYKNSYLYRYGFMQP